MAGATPLVVHVDDVQKQSRAKYAFIKSPVRIGRSEINDLHLDRPYVSTFHGVVQFDGERVTFVDLGSTNGTMLADARLEKNVPVEIGPADELRIGGLRLRLTRDTAVDAAPAPRKATQFMRAVAARADSRRALAPVAAAPPGVPPAPIARPLPGVVAAGPKVAPPPAVAAPGGASPSSPAAAPPAPAVPPPRDPADDRARRAIDDAAWQLQVLHDAWADARRIFDEAAEAVVQRVPDADRARCRALLADRYAAARSAAASPAPAVSAPAPAATLAEPAAEVAMLRDFAAAYLPEGAAIEDAAQAQAFLEAVADVLETSARSYIELRRGYEEFGKEMGLRVAQGEGPVARARDTRQLLAWLLARCEEPRAQELSGAFADLMIHQVALLNAVTEGGKALVAQLSPEEITVALEREGAGRLALGVKTLREGAQWRAFLDRYRALTEDEGALSSALFGKEFARAYSAVVGRRDASRDGGGDGQDDDGQDDRARPGPGRPGR